MPGYGHLGGMVNQEDGNEHLAWTMKPSDDKLTVSSVVVQKESKKTRVGSLGERETSEQPSNPRPTENTIRRMSIRSDSLTLRGDIGEKIA